MYDVPPVSSELLWQMQLDRLTRYIACDTDCTSVLQYSVAVFDVLGRSTFN